MAMAGDGGLLTTMAFAQIPIIGPGILIVGIITFAFCNDSRMGVLW